MLQTNFVSNARKTAHTNVVTTKYILMNPNKHIYNFWMIVFCFGYSVVQLQMEILAMIICQTRSQLQRNKEIILHLTKKERNMFTGKARSCWVKQRRTFAFVCFKISDTFQ